MLDKLPTEVVLIVATYLLPDSLFNLAITCQGVFQNLEDLVRKQKRYAELYSTVDTRHPLSVITALRRVLTDSNAAWHLRSINIWRTPSSIGHWDDRAGQDDIDYVTNASSLPLLRSHSYIGKQAYKRLRRRWRDFTHLRIQHDPPALLASAVFPEAEKAIQQSLMLPFDISLAAQRGSSEAGACGPTLFLLIACAPRLRNLWLSRRRESRKWCLVYLTKFFLQLNTLLTGQKGLNLEDKRVQMTADEVTKSCLPLGFTALRYVDLTEMPPFLKYDVLPKTGMQRDIDMIRFFLVLPKLELLRQALRFHGDVDDDLVYIFEWEPQTGTLRESIMSFTDDEDGGSSLLNTLWYAPMKILRQDIGEKILSYECQHSTTLDIRALILCAAQSLESLTFTMDVPQDLSQDLGRSLRAFKRLKSLTISAEYLAGADGVVHGQTTEDSPLPASLEHLMIHDGSYASRRPRGEAEMLAWATAMGKLGDRLITRLYILIATEQLHLLESLATICHERNICLHIWSGDPVSEARTCPHLCGRFVPTQAYPLPWPDGPRSWNYWSTYDWVEGIDKLPYGESYPWQYPVLDDRPEVPEDLLKARNHTPEDDESLFALTQSVSPEERARPDSIGEESNILEGGILDELAETLYKRFHIEEDKARRVEECIELGQKVIKQLGGEGGRLLCEDYQWKRVYD